MNNRQPSKCDLFEMLPTLGKVQCVLLKIFSYLIRQSALNIQYLIYRIYTQSQYSLIFLHANKLPKPNKLRKPKVKFHNIKFKRNMVLTQKLKCHIECIYTIVLISIFNYLNNSCASPPP